MSDELNGDGSVKDKEPPVVASSESKSRFTSPISLSDEKDKIVNSSEYVPEEDKVAVSEETVNSLGAEMKSALDTVAHQAIPGQCVILVGNNEQAEYVSAILHNMGRKTSVRIAADREMPIWRVAADKRQLEEDGLKVV